MIVNRTVHSKLSIPPSPRPHLDLFEDPSQLGVVCICERPEVGSVDARAGLAAGADVIIDVVALRGQDPHTAAVEPVLARVAADVEPDGGEGGGELVMLSPV